MEKSVIFIKDGQVLRKLFDGTVIPYKEEIYDKDRDTKEYTTSFPEEFNNFRMGHRNGEKFWSNKITSKNKS